MLANNVLGILEVGDISARTRHQDGTLSQINNRKRGVRPALPTGKLTPWYNPSSGGGREEINITLKKVAGNWKRQSKEERQLATANELGGNACNRR